MRTLLLALFLVMSGTAVAEVTDPPAAEQLQNTEIPTAEKEFVATINGFEKAKIVEQLGEPSKKNDIKTNTGRVVASVWHYHFLNTATDGAYYETTELDFVNDKVVMVVFMNSDGTDIPENAVHEMTPPVVPDL
jgi:hypothetical protein